MLDGAGRRTNLPGYSAECVSGHHSECHDSDCRCLCSAHPRNLEMMQKPNSRPSTTPASNQVCPICDRVPRVGDLFCRTDGTKLISGKMCRCGKAAEPDDKFCGGCGQLFGPPAVLVPELSEEEIAALEAKARLRPSDVEVPPTGVH